MEGREFVTSIIAKADCCGLNLQICGDGFMVDLRNGDTKKLTNEREAAIVFSEEVASLVFYKALAFLAAYGYNGYMGERGDKA